MKKVRIIGAGLAGCEAALQLANADFEVDLYEMRPLVSTPAHQTGLFAELVCSNSLKSSLLTTASGLLKAELDLLGCELLKIARTHSVPAGNALAVDRTLFAKAVTAEMASHPLINIINEEVCELDNNSAPPVRAGATNSAPPVRAGGDRGVVSSYLTTILATGPLTSDKLTHSLMNIIGDEHLYFFDAIAPIVSADSLDMNKIFSQTRYDKGEADYLNCPFTAEEYYRFVDALIDGDKHQAREFEKSPPLPPPDGAGGAAPPVMAGGGGGGFKFYENCTPIEELARRGRDTLRFGVLKPVGLIEPHTQKRPFAVLQLRTENAERTAYNLVGCQTMLRYGEQKRIFSLIPGLENADFLRYGSIHRNTYLNTPLICNSDFSLKNAPHIRLAGQITGVEGYVESIFSGLLTAQILMGKIQSLPPETICGQLWRYLMTVNENFVPMNANFGLLPEIDIGRRDKRLKKEGLSQRSLRELGVRKCEVRS